jgi:NDP-sugar pyrophosphorylase family protein
MQIIIPMSGFGERFRAEGFMIPKPLIEVEGKTVISHVVDLFPGDHDFIFICNEDHLRNSEWNMQAVLESLSNSTRIISISAHKLGPVNAILKAKNALDLNAETIVNYADFTCRLDFDKFLDDIRVRSLSGSVPAYRGFHPHSGGSTNYAYIKENDFFLEDIREKAPFTDNKVAEFASSGTYYFKSASLMLDLFEEQVSKGISVSSEFYVSSSMALMRERGLDVGVFELEHFMQWGTPQDLWEYEHFSNLFHQLANFDSASLEISGVGASLILASGEGKRFQDKGYRTPKTLLPVSGSPLVSQLVKAVDSTQPLAISVLAASVQMRLREAGFDNILMLAKLSQGQADTASQLVESQRHKIEDAFSIFPNDTLFADATGSLSDIVSTSNDFLVAWVSQPSPFAKANPNQFGWIWEDSGQVVTALKRAPADPTARVITGAFTFSSRDTFQRLFNWVESNNKTINGELYLDSFIEGATQLGISISIFEPQISITLGTPYEYESFRYWQSCFDQWGSHPYNLEADPFVAKGNLRPLRDELRSTKHEPSEHGF